MSPHIRLVANGERGTAVQVVWSNRGGRRDITHLGTARDPAQLELLKVAGSELIAAGQGELDLGLGRSVQAPLDVVASRMGPLLDALGRAFGALGFDQACGHDEVFKDLVVARIIEPTSKLDSLRVLTEAGVAPASYATVKRRLPIYAKDWFRAAVAQACAAHAHVGPSDLVLYDVTTLYFEIHEPDGFRESGYSKERRVEPQITLGLLTDRNGFPLQVEAFEGNKAETQTMLPVLQDYVTAHQLRNVTVVADAGMMSRANLAGIEAQGWTFVVGGKIPDIPLVITQWMETHPGQEFDDGLILVQTWPKGTKSKTTPWREIYQYRAARARRTLKGISEQVAKAERAAQGHTPVKRNKYLAITGAQVGVNWELVAKHQTLAGWKTYTTNLDDDTSFIIGAYHQLYQVEKSFRMSKHDLRARPIYHHKRQSIEAHLTIVFAALAVAHWLETRTGWSIKRLVRQLRTKREYQINVSGHTVTAIDPLPDDIRHIITAIHQPLDT